MAKKVYIVELDARNEAALRKIREVEGVTLKASDRMSKAFNRVGVALVAAFSAQQVLSFIKSSIEAYKESEIAIKKLDTALGKNSKSLQNYAKDLQKITTFSDDATIEAMSLIAAFTKEEDKIKGLIRVTQDFATAKGVDLSSAADLVTKTFASSTNALARYGIKVEGAAGSTERYNSILKALTIYLGQAEAQGKTLTGQMEILNNELNDQQEDIGAGLLPVWLALNQALAFGLKLMQATSGLTGGKMLAEQFLGSQTGKSLDNPMFEFVGNVKESIPWLKQQQDRLKEIKKSIDAGNLSESGYMALKKEEATIEKSLTLEKEKQVKLEATRIIQFKTAADLWDSIQNRKLGESERDRRIREGPGELGFGKGRVFGGPASETERASKALEVAGMTTEDMLNNFGSMVGSAQNIASILNVGAHTFVGTMLRGLNDAGSILSSIFSIIGAVASFVSPAGLASMAFEKGGRITNLGGNITHTKIPSFAMGGSYTTPAYGGGYPVMVHKNETLDVYNAGQTSRMENKMDRLINAVLTTNLHVSKGGKNQSQPIIVNVDGQTLFKVNTRRNNRASRAGVNTGELI